MFLKGNLHGNMEVYWRREKWRQIDKGVQVLRQTKVKAWIREVVVGRGEGQQIS